MDDDLRWAYAAGLVDGEGCISIQRHFYSHKKRPGLSRYNVNISVAMNDPEGIAEIAHLWGTSMRADRATVPGNGRSYRTLMFRTYVSRVTEVERILSRLLPYLRAKRAQATVVLEACRDIRSYLHKHDIPQEVRERWDQQYEECRALKIRNASEVIFPAAV